MFVEWLKSVIDTFVYDYDSAMCFCLCCGYFAMFVAGLVMFVVGRFVKKEKKRNSKLSKYITDEKAAKDLAQALKIATNSVYGITSAKFEEPCCDPRNVDN